MLSQKKIAAVLVFGFCLSWLEAGYAGFTKLSEVFPDQDIPETWTISTVPRGSLGDIYLIEAYPKAEGKKVINYAPTRQGDEAFDRAVFTRVPVNNSALKETLEKWTKEGFSAHYLINPEGTLVEWFNPFVYKAQMAGETWNNKAVQILMLTDDDKNMSEIQTTKLESLFKHLKEDSSSDHKINIQQSGYHQATNNEETEETVGGLDELMKKLEIKPLTVEKTAP
ncbi:MAG: hypothetical protein ACRCTK_05280 [Alphaproteobacteria bacterium]